jgi:pescadillo protein
VKGVYYQSELLGQKITYITPHRYPQQLPADVDYRVMCTFLDFYLTLLKFVNFKLYLGAGLVYPPEQKQQGGGYLGYELKELPRGEKEDDGKYVIDEKFRNIEEEAINQ